MKLYSGFRVRLRVHVAASRDPFSGKKKPIGTDCLASTERAEIKTSRRLASKCLARKQEAKEAKEAKAGQPDQISSAQSCLHVSSRDICDRVRLQWLAHLRISEACNLVIG
jgi:hypothetical protein